MIDKIPKVSEKQIKEQGEQLKAMITKGAVTEWLDSQLKALAATNPVLYQYLMEHSQKFAMGAVMVDAQSIAMSQALEQVMLLTLIGGSYRANEDLKKFEGGVGKLLGDIDLGGLDGNKKP